VINIEDLIKAYEVDANDPKGLGHFEVLQLSNFHINLLQVISLQKSKDF
jgi:hypothetical protein